MAAKLLPIWISAAQEGQRKWGINASLSLAQFGVESGWGQHMPPGTNNPFGIKARQDPKTGRFLDPIAGQSLTREVVDGENVVIHAAFRRFASLGEAFDYHAELLATKGVYAQFRLKLKADGVLAALPLLAHTYATDPHYAELLAKIIECDGLRQYDVLPHAAS